MNNRIKNNSILIISMILIFTMFSFGFLIGLGVMYSQYSNEILELQDTINEIQLDNNYSNITFYYNETSLSNIYDIVKDSMGEPQTLEDICKKNMGIPEENGITGDYKICKKQ